MTSGSTRWPAVRPCAGRVAATAVLASLVWWAPAPADAQLVVTDLSAADATTVNLTLSWSAPVRVQAEIRPHELILRADQQLDHDGFLALAPRLKRWLVGLFLGYDSLVMTLAPGVSAAVQAQGSGATIRLSLATAANQPAAVAPTAAAAGRRLQFLKASLLWSTGEAWEAAELLRQMGNERPEDAEILAARSLVEGRIGRWRLASEYLARSRALQHLPSRGDRPVAGDLNAPLAQVEVLQDSQAGGLRRDGLRADGHAFVAPGLRLRLAYEGADVGERSDHLATLGLRYDGRSGSWLAGHGKVRVAGAGAVIAGEIWDALGSTGLALAWQEPRWELPVLVALDATRDAVGLTRSLRSWSGLGRALAGDVSLHLGGHFERWQAAEGRLSDLLATASLRYASWTARPRLWAEYAVVHLHVLGGASTSGGLGAALSRSHIHSLSLGAVQPLWRWLQIGGSLGYATSYWGADAALVGAQLSWQPPTGPRAQVHFRRGVQASTYGTATNSLGIRAGWAF